MNKQEWRKEFSRVLRVRMRRKNMTQKELAEEADVTETTMSRYMNATRSPETYALVRIAKALDCSVDELVMFDDEN